MEPDISDVRTAMEDSKGRTLPEYMEHDEKVTEILLTMRNTQDMVEAFIKDFSNNPMLGMFGKMLGKKG